MVITNYGRTQVALRIGSDISSPGFTGIGTGSAQITITTTGLTTHTDRNAFTTLDLSFENHVKTTSNFSSIEMSGTVLTEFGIFDLSSGGKLWSKTGIAGVTFDGQTELQIETDWEVF